MKINGNTYLNIVPLGAFRIVHPPPPELIAICPQKPLGLWLTLEGHYSMAV